MTATKAAIILRNIRSRMESGNGLSQLCGQDVVALAIANEMLPEPLELGQLHMKWTPVAMHPVVFLIADKKAYEAVREAYKALDKEPPDREFKYENYDAAYYKVFPIDKEHTITPEQDDVVKKLLGSVPTNANDVPPDKMN